MSDEILYYIWLTAALHPGNPRKWDILGSEDSIASLYRHIRSGDRRLPENEYNALVSYDLKKAESVLDYCIARGYGVICPADPEYPASLAAADDPPGVLFTLGDICCLENAHTAAVVGSRKADDYALRCTRHISGGLASAGAVIISGFAVGVDSAAHSAAINAGGRTVAVLGCGLDYDYPRNSKPLRYAIAKHGAVITEYFPDTRPIPANFPIRNRITAALSDCIVCTSASSRSGVLNTVSHGLFYSRDIFITPPHDIFSPNYQGIISLLRDGAVSVCSAEDVIRYMGWG